MVYFPISKCFFSEASCSSIDMCIELHPQIACWLNNEIIIYTNYTFRESLQTCIFCSNTIFRVSLFRIARRPGCGARFAAPSRAAPHTQGLEKGRDFRCCASGSQRLQFSDGSDTSCTVLMRIEKRLAKRALAVKYALATAHSRARSVCAL